MKAKLIYGNNSKNIQCSVMGFQLCTMSHCKKHVQQVMPLAIKTLKIDQKRIF